MTVHLQCDYCGGPIEDDDLSLEWSVRGREPSDGRYPVHVLQSLGHFHTGPVLPGGESCDDKVYEAFRLTCSWGPTLETIETKSGQWVAQQRRKHTKPDGGER